MIPRPSHPQAHADDPTTAGNGSNAPLITPFAAGPAGFLTPQDLEPPPRRLGGAGVLILILVCAGGVLAGMRQLGMGPRLALADIKIDYPIESPAAHDMPDHSAVIEDLKSGGRVRRVPLELVQTNPFAWRSLLPAEVTPAPNAKDEDLARKKLEERQRLIAQAAGRLILHSIMGGRTPLARISGELVRVGDRVGEHFTVESISGRSVVLRSGEQLFTLTLGESARDAGPVSLPPR